MALFDILLDEVSQELTVTNGDFTIGDPTNQYQYYIIISAPGHFKEFPLLGASIFSFLNTTATPAEIERAIRVQLNADVFPDAFVDASKFPTIVVNKITIKLTSQ